MRFFEKLALRRVGCVSQLSYWEIKWAIPATVVQAASLLTRSTRLEDVLRGLLVIAESECVDEWVRLLARELARNPSRVKEILSYRITPESRLLSDIMNKVRYCK